MDGDSGELFAADGTMRDSGGGDAAGEDLTAGADLTAGEDLTAGDGAAEAVKSPENSGNDGSVEEISPVSPAAEILQGGSAGEPGNAGGDPEGGGEPEGEGETEGEADPEGSVNGADTGSDSDTDTDTGSAPDTCSGADTDAELSSGSGEELLRLEKYAVLRQILSLLRASLPDLERELRLPEKSLVTEVAGSGTGRSGRIVSCSLGVWEQAYPPSADSAPERGRGILQLVPVHRVRSATVLDLRTTGRLHARLEGYVPGGAEVRESTSRGGDDAMSVTFRFSSPAEQQEAILGLCRRLVLLSLQDYRTRAAAFGCCHRFRECSRQGRCVHPNLLYATACQYRENLEQGRIFLGDEGQGGGTGSVAAGVSVDPGTGSLFPEAEMASPASADKGN